MLALFSTFTTLVTLAAWPLAFATKIVLLLLAGTPAILALLARRSETKAAAEVDAAMERAWLTAAEDVVTRARKGITATELASQLAIDATRADRLLTQLTVHDRTRVDIDDDAAVRYSLPSEARTNVRIGEARDDVVDTHETNGELATRPGQRQ